MSVVGKVAAVVKRWLHFILDWSQSVGQQLCALRQWRVDSDRPSRLIDVNPRLTGTTTIMSLPR